jgi:DNA-3-methyladenine glycosylase
MRTLQHAKLMPRLRKLKPADFHRNAEALAEFLIGTILIRRTENEIRRVRIVETEAYVGPEDLASHTSRGRTPRTATMFGPPGRAYVYFVYGMHHMLNIVAGPAGSGQAVLVRAAEPLDGWLADLSGPGKLARALQITRAHNGLTVTGPEISLWLDPASKPQIARSKRIGVDYAKHWKDAMLRFVDAASASVSKSRP